MHDFVTFITYALRSELKTNLDGSPCAVITFSCGDRLKILSRSGGSLRRSCKLCASILFVIFLLLVALADEVSVEGAAMEEATAPPKKVARLANDGPGRRQTRSVLPGLDLKKCLFCQSEKRQRKNRRLTEKLIRCTWHCTPSTLVRAARIRQDERVLLEIEDSDLHAKDVLYHASCYKDFTCPRQLDLLLQKELESEVDVDSPQKRAFSKLVGIMEKRFQDDNNCVMSLGRLTGLFKELLQEEGVDADNFRAFLLKARLVKHFGDALSFHRPRKQNESQYVFRTSVNPGPLIELCIQLEAAEEQRVDHGEDMDIDDIPDVRNEDTQRNDDALHLFSAAMLLRKDILSMKPPFPFPPSPGDIAEGNFQLPTSLYNFLCWLICGDQSTEAVSVDQPVEQPPPALNRRVQSIGQDLIFCASKGQVKTPKHVALPIALKHITGSSQFVTVMNRFGHGISESQLEEVDTALAEKHICEREHHGAVIPSNIQPTSFITLCWDNNDIAEETASGLGTTHCTNGIVVQRQVTTVLPKPHKAQVTDQPTRRQHRRSIHAPQLPQIDYNAGQRQGPLPLSMPDKALALDCLPLLLHSSSEVDFGWTLARLMTGDSPTLGQQTQQTPGWAGFNALLQVNAVIRPSVVGYLPVIPASPTEMSTVYHLLQRSLAIADSLGQHSIPVVLDQAIFAKAKEVMWKHRQQFARVVLMMGGFHTSMVFMGVIGKRFGDAGLHDIMVESGVVGPAAIATTLSGKHYNRGIRSHLLVMEALLRLLWRKFESWLSELQGDGASLVSENLRQLLDNLRQGSFSPQQFGELQERLEFKALLRVFTIFCEALPSPTARFWLSYIDMVQLLMNYIRSLRLADWKVYLWCIRQMLPWVFAYGRTHNSRFLSLHWCEMTTLSDSHPDVHQELLNGEFCVQRSNSFFSQVAVDQAIEQTVNRDTKCRGGIIGFSRNQGAVHRWMITAHHRAEFSNTLREMAGLGPGSAQSAHKECTPSRIGPT